MYSSGVFLALKSGEMAADTINEALASGRADATNLSKWGDQLTDGMQTIRKLVYAFYTPGFSFGRFIRANPDRVDDVTAILVGDVFRPEVKDVFRPLNEMARLPEATMLDKPKALRQPAENPA
jgi:flavin-dependent dehydrogenase